MLPLETDMVDVQKTDALDIQSDTRSGGSPPDRDTILYHPFAVTSKMTWYHRPKITLTGHRCNDK